MQLIESKILAGEVLCFGFCARCQTHHYLDSMRARPHAMLLMENLALHRRLDWEIPLEQADPRLSTDVLFEGRGQMFGVLLCEDQEGNEHLLKAFSCTHNQVWNVPGWAPSLVDEQAYREIVQDGDRRTRPINQRIKTMDLADPQRSILHQERQGISLEITDRLFGLYHLKNFRGESRPLFEASLVGKRVATGTGDCCAPKLLAQAIQLGLRPLSLAEFYWGRPTENGQRQQGQFYPICKNRCEPILGFMLCGGCNAN